MLIGIRMKSRTARTKRRGKSGSSANFQVKTKADIERMEYRKKGIDVRKKTCRKRLESPKKFDKRSFRSVKRDGTIIVVGCPKGKYDTKRRKCRTGTRAQSVVKKRLKSGKCPSFEGW